MNFQGKHLNHLAFFSEVLTAPPALVLAALAAILMLAGLGARPPSPRVP
jgi:hypothetical protein